MSLSYWVEGKVLESWTIGGSDLTGKAKVETTAIREANIWPITDTPYTYALRSNLPAFGVQLVPSVREAQTAHCGACQEIDSRIYRSARC
jgi:hypothetical protein